MRPISIILMLYGAIGAAFGLAGLSIICFNKETKPIRDGSLSFYISLLLILILYIVLWPILIKDEY
jgi:hypothetical protein